MNTQTSYDRVADEYARQIFDELQHKPLDRQLLNRFAASVRDVGPACDIGCGPGHVTRYLREHGVRACGLGLSAEMVKRARDLTPDVEHQKPPKLHLRQAAERKSMRMPPTAGRCGQPAGRPSASFRFIKSRPLQAIPGFPSALRFCSR